MIWIVVASSYGIFVALRIVYVGIVFFVTAFMPIVVLSWMLTVLMVRTRSNSSLFRETIVKDNDFIHVKYGRSARNLTRDLRLEFARLAIGYDTARDGNAYRGRPRLAPTGSLFHDATKPMVFLLFLQLAGIQSLARTSSNS